MINPEYSLVKNGLNIGALTGILLSVLQLLLLTLGLGDSSSFQWILYLVMVLSILWGSRTYRDRVSEGYISYTQALGFGMLISIGASVVFSFFLYIYMKFIDAEYIKLVLEQMEMAMYEQEMDESEITMVMDLYRKFLTPAAMAFGMVFTYFLIGGVISLITSIFVKNPRTEF